MSANETTVQRPKNAIVVLLDSLNRHMLGVMADASLPPPTLDAFARRAVRFDCHYAGSLPCIPARHDILRGAINFLWKPWGLIEIWERPLTAYLRAAGVVTKLVSDHPYLFEVGGENYHTDFTAWDYQRGHESDPWQMRPDPSWIGAPSFARGIPRTTTRAVTFATRGFSGTAHDGGGDGLARAIGAQPRSLHAFRR